MADVNWYFREMVQRGASDLFISTNSKPSCRVHGDVTFIRDTSVTHDEARTLFEAIVPEPKRKRYFDTGELDLSYELEGAGRFRTNIFTQQGEMGFVFRHIKSQIPSMEELYLPAKVLKQLCEKHRGLILMTGITGSGKSTTLASMINFINTSSCRHVITIEDPIEYVYKEDKCIINQREIGMDTQSFLSALKYAMRQSPDVILVGEMRDLETIEAAINAAETGHLVMSTLHTVNAIQTVERIINFFPTHQHALIRMQMALILEGALSQRLILKSDGKGRVPAIEILLATPTVKEILAEGRTRDLEKALKEGDYYGTQTFNQSLKFLVNQKLITVEKAMEASDNPDELKLELRGIQKGGHGNDFNFEVK